MEDIPTCALCGSTEVNPRLSFKGVHFCSISHQIQYYPFRWIIGAILSIATGYFISFFFTEAPQGLPLSWMFYLAAIVSTVIAIWGLSYKYSTKKRIGHTKN